MLRQDVDIQQISCWHIMVWCDNQSSSCDVAQLSLPYYTAVPFWGLMTILSHPQIRTDCGPGSEHIHENLHQSL
jgi:hypothetical protein